MLISFFSSLSFYLSIFVLTAYYISCFIFENKFLETYFNIFNIKINLHQVFNILIFILIIFSFIGLIFCFGMHDFSLYIVYANSQTKQNYIYTIGASWSSYEGSMLLWLLIMSSSSLLNSLFLNSRNIINKKTYHLICHIQSGLQLLFYYIVFFIANPFKLTKENVLDGIGLNPLLHDYSLITHPPILFFGYSSTSILFSQMLGYAIIKIKLIYKEKSSINQNKFLLDERDFFLNLKKWSILPLLFLTIGISLGAGWSYRELGWGGFWAWDPVENVSLLPLIACLIIIHLAIKKTIFSHIRALIFFITSLSIYILSLFSTFVVRSGIVQSIHSFASSSSRSTPLLILIIILFLIMICSSIFYFYFRYKYIKSIKENSKLILFTSLNLYLMIFVIIFSIVFPIFFFYISKNTISLNENFFEYSFGILTLPAIYLINLSYFKIRKSFLKILFIQSTIISIILFIFYRDHIISGLNVFLGLATIINTFYYSIQKIQENRIYSKIPKIFGHLSFLLLIISSILCVVLEEKNESYISAEKNKIFFKNYEIELKSVNTFEDGNLITINLLFDLFYKNKEIGSLKPNLKLYKFEKMQIPDSYSISQNLLSDLYITISRIDQETKSILIITYYKPFINLLWFSCFLMSLSLILLFISYIRNKIRY